MPAVFARLDPQGTPAAGVLIAGTLATLLVFANFSKSLVQLFTFAILLSTAATLLPYLVSSAAWLRRGDRSGRVVALLALLYSAYALAGIGTESLLWGIVLVAAGLPVYWLVRRRRA
jgi:APA family basic amino acid/polyamine antiporter